MVPYRGGLRTAAPYLVLKVGCGEGGLRFRFSSQLSCRCQHSLRRLLNNGGLTKSAFLDRLMAIRFSMFTFLSILPRAKIFLMSQGSMMEVGFIAPGSCRTKRATGNTPRAVVSLS